MGTYKQGNMELWSYRVNNHRSEEMPEDDFKAATGIKMPIR
jgi:hypothetical protein